MAKNSAPIIKKSMETKMKTKAKNKIENKLFLEKMTPKAAMIMIEKSRYKNIKDIKGVFN